MTGQRGFTLTELVIVMVVIGILAAYAAPRFDRSNYDATAAADEIVEAIRYAQVLAMQHSGITDYYGFRVAGNGYSVATVAGTNVANPVSGSASYSESWSGGITLGANHGAIYFDGFGEPVDATGTPLGSDTAITVTSGSHTVTIRVERLSGYTRRS